MGQVSAETPAIADKAGPGSTAAMHDPCMSRTAPTYQCIVAELSDDGARRGGGRCSVHRSAQHSSVNELCQGEGLEGVGLTDHIEGGKEASDAISVSANTTRSCQTEDQGQQDDTTIRAVLAHSPHRIDSARIRLVQLAHSARTSTAAGRHQCMHLLLHQHIEIDLSET